MIFCTRFLAQMSQRLTRWAYSIPMVRRPSVVVVRRCPHFQTGIFLKPVGQSWSKFMCSITGWGKGCIRFWGRLDQNSGFHGNRKLPLTYNGENDVSTFPRLFLLWSFLYLQVTRTCITSQPDLTTDYAVSCPWASQKFPIDLQWENVVSMLARSFLIISSNQNRHKSLDEFDFEPDQTTHFGVTCPWLTKHLHFHTWISLRLGSQSWSNFMCSITGGGVRLHNVQHYV